MIMATISMSIISFILIVAEKDASPINSEIAKLVLLLRLNSKEASA